MRMPIDTSSMTFLAASPPEPVVEYGSKTAKVDETGQPLFAVQLVVLVDGGAEVISAKVAGLPKGVEKGNTVRVTGLVATPWTMGERSGIAYRASTIEPAAPVRNAA